MTDAKITELIKTDTKVGTGKEAVNNKLVIVHYTGWLYDPKAPKNRGTKFDSSVDRGQPFDFSCFTASAKARFVIPTFMPKATNMAVNVRGLFISISF